MKIRIHWLVGLAFVFAVAVTAVSAVRTARRAAYWHSHRDEPIHEWMTLGYIAHSYRVPPHVLYEALALSPQLPDKRPISRIARLQKHSVDEVIGVLANAIVQARLPNPPPSSAEGGTR